MVDEQGQPQDGALRLHDIYNLELPVELATEAEEKSNTRSPPPWNRAQLAVKRHREAVSWVSRATSTPPPSLAWLPVITLRVKVTVES